VIGVVEGVALLVAALFLFAEQRGEVDSTTAMYGVLLPGAFVAGRLLAADVLALLPTEVLPL